MAYSFLGKSAQPSGLMTGNKVDEDFVLGDVCPELTQLRGRFGNLLNSGKPEILDADSWIDTLNQTIIAITSRGLIPSTPLDINGNRNSLGNVGEEESVNTPTI